MIVKYRTGGFGKNLIEKIEVDRETESGVWINGRRNAKDSSWHKDYDSWLGELEVLAAAKGLEIHRDKYHYHTYFMRGWAPEGVIDDISYTRAASTGR